LESLLVKMGQFLKKFDYFFGFGVGEDLSERLNRSFERMEELAWSKLTVDMIPKEDLECPVCMNAMVNVVSMCDHKYCYDCVLKWGKENRGCGMCRNMEWLPCERIRPELRMSKMKLKMSKMPKMKLNQSIQSNKKRYNFVGQLYDYQLDACNWMSRVGKGILGYDMGLGKTPITIKYLCDNSDKLRCALVVMPLSLLEQWYDSVLKFSDLKSENVVIYHGKEKENYKYMSEHRVLLTNYDSLKCEKLRLYCKLFVDCVVVDEAHILRNSKTQKWKYVSDLSVNMSHRWLLTGTPIHNSLRDFESLSALCNGIYLPYELLQEWKQVYYRRKMKSDDDIVMKLNLPLKNVLVHELKLSVEHREEYNTIYTDSREFLMGNGETRGYNFGCVLAKITRLLQACNHPELTLTGELREVWNYGNVTSVKFECVKSLINEMPSDEKMVIFSRWNGSLRLLSEELKRKFPDLQLYDYNGGMTLGAKNMNLSAFKSYTGKCVLLANTLAGGCGLNLVESNHLILLEPSWTSATEQQAIDRIHRIGQKKEVNIHILRTKNTLESWIYLLKSEKGQLGKCFDKNESYEMNKDLVKRLLRFFIDCANLDEMEEHELCDHDLMDEEYEESLMCRLERLEDFEVPDVPDEPDVADDVLVDDVLDVPVVPVPVNGFMKNKKLKLSPIVVN